jgi:hypothetical protein
VTITIGMKITGKKKKSEERFLILDTKKRIGSNCWELTNFQEQNVEWSRLIPETVTIKTIWSHKCENEGAKKLKLPLYYIIMYRVILNLNDCSRSRPCPCYYVFAAFM